MEFTQIKKSLNELLKKQYPEIKIYGNEVKEGYKMPSFFTSLVSFPETPANKNFMQGGFTFKIVYFQAKKDEMDQLEKLDKIYEAFGLSVQIGKRHLIVKEKDFDYVGEKADILEISLKFEHIDNKYMPLEEEVADELKLKIEKQEE